MSKKTPTVVKLSPEDLGVGDFDRQMMLKTTQLENGEITKEEYDKFLEDQKKQIQDFLAQGWYKRTFKELIALGPDFNPVQEYMKVRLKISDLPSYTRKLVVAWVSLMKGADEKFAAEIDQLDKTIDEKLAELVKE